MEPRLVDVIRALEKRERYEDAEYYKVMIPLQLSLLHGLTEEKVLNMTIDEIEGYFNMPPVPLKYEGWNFWWGPAVDANYRERNA
jgi:hypothetical protein